MTAQQRVNRLTPKKEVWVGTVAAPGLAIGGMRRCSREILLFDFDSQIGEFWCKRGAFCTIH